MKNSKINGEWTTKELQNNKDWLINLDDLDKNDVKVVVKRKKKVRVRTKG